MHFQYLLSYLVNGILILFVLSIQLSFSTPLVKSHSCYKFVLLPGSEKRTSRGNYFELSRILYALLFFVVCAFLLPSLFMDIYICIRARDQLLRFGWFILSRFFSVNWQWSIAIRVNIYRMYHFTLHCKILQKNNQT